MNTQVNAGDTFGRLTVLSVSRRESDNRVICKCHCTCGNVSHPLAKSLRNGNTTSCGCYRQELRFTQNKKHGLTYSSEWYSWASMKKRCTNSRVKEWLNYGGRGITFCPQWAKFEVFLADMGRKPTTEHQIDRIDNNGNYEPSNCRWATPLEQSRNKQDTVRITYKGETRLASEWASIIGINYGTLLFRLRKGWSAEDAIEIPLQCTSIIFNGETKTLSEWARHLGIKNRTLQSRIHEKKWDPIRALTTPVRKKKE